MRLSNAEILSMENPRPRFNIPNERVGIDLDEPDILTRIFAYYNLNSINRNGTKYEIRIYRSSSGKGYHLELRGLKPNLDVRRNCRDDAKRIEISESRQGWGVRWDVLFQEKRSDFHRDKEWKQRELITLKDFLALPFTVPRQLFFTNRRNGEMVHKKRRKLKRNAKWRGRW